MVEVLGPEGEETVMKLSENPHASLEKLRQLAADTNIAPGF